MPAGFQEQLLEALVEAVVVTDLEGRILYWNEGAERLYGWPRHEVLGRNVLDVTPTGASREEAAKIMARLSRGESWSGEFQVQTREGEPLWVSVTDTPLVDGDGRLAGIIGVSFRIDDRRRAEEELRQSEERLRLALEAGRMGTWEWDIIEGAIHWPPAMEAIHGLEPGTFGGTLADFSRDIHPDDLERVLRTIQESVRGPTSEYHVEYRIIDPDGGIRWLEARGSVRRDAAGAPLRMLGICSDVTERKRAEERARFLAHAGRMLASSLEYEETLRAVARLPVPDLADWCAVLLVDADGRLRSVEVAHRDPDRVGIARELLRRYAPDPESSGGVGAVVATGESRLLPEIPPALLEAAARDAEHLRALEDLGLRSAMVVPLTARDQNLGAIVLITGDSGRRFGPEDLELADGLASRAALALDNARLYAEAQEALRARQELMAVVSHDLRNPLHTIQMATGLLARRDLPEAERASQTAALERTVARMDRLIRDLLEVSSIEAGQLRLEREDLDVERLLQDSVDLLRGAADQKRLRWRIVPEPGPLRVRGDRHRILQVLSNLIGNAIKFTPEGGIIEVAAQRSGQEVAFAVADTGCGIADSELPHLFERFWQAQRGSGGGIGLGLPIAKGIVEAHGGRIWAESVLGEGTTVHFSLPAATGREET